MRGDLKIAAVGLGVVLLWGCTPAYYRKSADRETAKVIRQKSPAVPNMETNFTIVATNKLSLELLPVRESAEDFLGPAQSSEIGARVLSLDEALQIAVEHSPTYQNRKEVLFLQALSLTLARYRFTPLFRGTGNGFYESRASDVSRDVARAIDQIAGTQTAVTTRETVLVREESIRAHTDGGVDILLRTGARLSADFTTDFLRFVTGDPRFFTSSLLAASLTQPLLRGAGFKVTMENLTQAERDVLYALREFVRFRQDFAVQLASNYYQVLQSRDRAANAWLGLQNFRQNVVRERAFADEGQRTQTALGQLQQAELNSETSWINATRNYQLGLDNFKILLGIPVETRIALDEHELEKLTIVHPKIEVTDAVRVAVATRMDLATAKDQFEDAYRRIDVSKNALLPDLNVIVNTSIDSKSGNQPLSLDFQRARWSAGLDVRLPLDRKAERNSYRTALIGYERAGRTLVLAVDQVKLDVTDGWRSLDQERRNFEIADIGVKLSERRVEEQELLNQLGRGTARDLVDARTDLINARNQRTGALIQHTVARIRFWRDLGILYIQENGQWKEPNDAAKL